MKKVDSSHVHDHSYDHETKKLTVHFKNGKVYEYHDVRPDEYAALDSASSAGKHLIKHIFSKKKGFLK